MRVSVLSFATFVAAPPLAKIASVQSARATEEAEYDPRLDWWKQLREFIPRNHRQSGGPRQLREFAAQVTERKQASYQARVEAYVDFLRGRQVRWVGGSSVTWTQGALEVAVNPEVFLSIDGVRHVVKLYFKASERLSADRISVILRMMELSYRGGATPEGRPVVGVLDLAQGQWHVPTDALDYLDALLAGEASAFATVWRSL